MAKISSGAGEGSPGELIAIMGATGSGKSSFINRLVGREIMKEGHTMKSCTSKVHELAFEMDGRQGCLIDTPGFDDTTLTDTEILKQISAWLETTYRLGRRITGIIYLVDISEKKMKGSALKNHAMFMKLCGTDSLGNVLIVTTHWDTVNHDLAISREEQLSNEYFQPMLADGARIQRHDNSPQSASTCVRKLLGNPPTILSIQSELVDRNLKLADTAAGLAVNKELAEVKEELKQQYEETLANIKTAHNERMKEIFEKQNDTYRRELDRIEDAKRELEKGDQNFTSQIADLNSRLEQQAKVTQKSTMDVLLDLLKQATPVLIPMAMSAISNSRMEKIGVSATQRSVDVPFFVPVIYSEDDQNLVDLLKDYFEI